MVSMLGAFVVFLAGLVLGGGAVWLLARARMAGDAVTQARLQDSFKALAADTLRANNESFLQLAESRLKQSELTTAASLDRKTVAIDEMMKPVRESLAKMDGQLQALEVKREGAYRELLEVVRQTHDTHQLLRGETSQLLQALRNPNARGRWGEVQLRRIVEMVGMAAYAKDFAVQTSFATDDGALRPDMIVNLPGAGCIILDSKVPLTAYLNASQCIDAVERQELLKQHAKQVRGHVKALAAKAYWEQVTGAPEYVVMFLPGDHFLGAALDDDPDLFDYSAGQRVILATPMTLIGLLRTVAYNWRQEDLRANVQQVGKLGGELYGALANMHDNIVTVGSRLASGVDAYNKLIGNFGSTVLGKARKLRDFGMGKDGKALPDSIEPVEKVIRTLDAPDSSSNQDAA